MSKRKEFFIAKLLIAMFIINYREVGLKRGSRRKRKGRRGRGGGGGGRWPELGGELENGPRGLLEGWEEPGVG